MLRTWHIKICIASDAVKYVPDSGIWSEDEETVVFIDAVYYLKAKRLKGSISVTNMDETYIDAFDVEIMKIKTNALLPVLRAVIPLEDENDHYSRLLYFSLWKKDEWCIEQCAENRAHLLPKNNAEEILEKWFAIN